MLPVVLCNFEVLFQARASHESFMQPIAYTKQPTCVSASLAQLNAYQFCLRWCCHPSSCCMELLFQGVDAYHSGCLDGLMADAISMVDLCHGCAELAPGDHRT